LRRRVPARRPALAAALPLVMSMPSRLTGLAGRGSRPPAAPFSPWSWSIRYDIRPRSATSA